MIFEDSDDTEYYEAFARDLEKELDAFERHILPVFTSRGYAKGQALQYYSMRRIEEAIDNIEATVERNVDPDEGSGESWKT